MKRSADKVRVLFVNTRSALGADVAVHLSLIQNLDPERVEVFVATNRNAEDLEQTLTYLNHLPASHRIVCDLGQEVSGKNRGRLGRLLGGLQNVRALWTLLRLAGTIRRHKIELLHATDRPRDALFSTLLARLGGCRNVIHVHIKWFAQMGRITTWAVGSCTAVLAISQFVRRSLIEGGIPESKCYTALNSSDPTRFDPAGVPRGFLRKRFGLKADTPLIGIVARIMVWKGHLELIEALAEVKEAVPDVRLAIVGKEDLLAAEGTDSFAEKVRQRIKELGLESHVLWVGWCDETPEVMADLDVLAAPSWEEPFGLVVTEAMAMQRPVVGFASGALPEIITDGVEGRLVPCKDSHALANALIELLQNPQKRQEMGCRGRQRVLREFTPCRMAQDVEEVYRQILA